MKRLLSVLLILAITLVMFSGNNTVLAQEEPTAEPTEEPTAEPTEEPTAEPTEEPTAEPTEEPTAEPTEEPTAEPTVEPQLGAGEIGAQGWTNPYTGNWTSDVAVQNIGTGPANVTVSWYTNNAPASCAVDSTVTNLPPGASARYSPPSGGCGPSWQGSAVVSGNQPLAATVCSAGSIANLLSCYTSGGDALQPTTETKIFPLMNADDFDPVIIGISNAGGAPADVRVSLYNTAGTLVYFKDTTIPSQSAALLDVRDDITLGGAWGGLMKIENTGTPQPLYVTMKADRVSYGPYPFSMSFEGYGETSDASTEWFVPTVARVTIAPNSWTEAGTNATLAWSNPSTTQQATVTVKWYNVDGTEVVAARQTVATPAQGSRGVISAQNFGLGNRWGGSATIESNIPIVVLVHRWWKDTTYYGSWVTYRPVKDFSTAGSNTLYFPAFYKESLNTVWNGWNTLAYVANLDTTQSARLRFEVFNAAGTAVFSEDRDIAANGRTAWGANHTMFDGPLGGTFFGGAKITVIDPGTGLPTAGRLVGSAEVVLPGYKTTDGYGSYDPINANTP